MLESYRTKTRNKGSALKLPKNAMRRYGDPHVAVTDRCGSYRVSVKVIGSGQCPVPAHAKSPEVHLNPFVCIQSGPSSMEYRQQGPVQMTT
nr:hypothetical protein [Hyphomonas adhaerens]